MGQFLQDRENVQIMSKFFFETSLWPNGLIFQDFSTVLKNFCPEESKNSFILVLAHFLLSNFYRLPPTGDF